MKTKDITDKAGNALKDAFGDSGVPVAVTNVGNAGQGQVRAYAYPKTPNYPKTPGHPAGVVSATSGANGGESLAHELGHVAGYKAPKPYVDGKGRVQPNHSSDPNNIMAAGEISHINEFRPSIRQPDCEWCNKIKALAK